MKKLLIAVCALTLLALPMAAGAAMYKFSGGPSGGTYQYYASAITSLSQQHKDSGIRVLASSSGGSIENIRLVDAGRSQFGVAYSGHVFQARNGMLKNDTKKYENVTAMAYFYGAPAQLIVRQGSGINKTTDLIGKRVGVGNAGSGAAANCELFFTELGIWDKIDANFLGYRQAAEAFQNRQLDAFWVFVGFPNASVIEAALQNKIKLIDVYDDAEEIGMFNKYPYFAKVTIPAGTYQGVDKDTVSFQDSAIWIASPKVSADDAYKLLDMVFSPEGLKFMVAAHKSAKAMSIASGINGIKTPLHPGAEKFWREKGVLK